jgi:hypothetical protein
VLCSPGGGVPSRSRLNEIPDGSTGLSVLIDASSGVELGPGLMCLVQGGLGLRDGRGEIGRLDSGDGLCGDLGLGVDNGGEVELLLFRQAGDGVGAELLMIGQAGVDRPGGGSLCRPVPPQVLCGLVEVVGNGPRVS